MNTQDKARIEYIKSVQGSGNNTNITLVINFEWFLDIVERINDKELTEVFLHSIQNDDYHVVKGEERITNLSNCKKVISCVTGQLVDLT